MSKREDRLDSIELGSQGDKNKRDLDEDEHLSGKNLISEKKENSTVVTSSSKTAAAHTQDHGHGHEVVILIFIFSDHFHSPCYF
jgi:hypothetical protein